MSEPTSNLSGKLDEIQAKGDKLTEAILIFRWARMRRVTLPVEPPIDYNLEPGFADLIINTLADLVIRLNDKNVSRKEKKDKLLGSYELKMVYLSLEKEVEELYTAIKRIGFSGRIVDAQDKWKKAAIDFYDQNKHLFEAIKRDYLEDPDLYAFRSTHEKADFFSKLIQKIFKENDLPFFGRDLHEKHYRDVTKRK